MRKIVCREKCSTVEGRHEPDVAVSREIEFDEVAKGTVVAELADVNQIIPAIAIERIFIGALDTKDITKSLQENRRPSL
jgi:hypothetical protein